MRRIIDLSSPARWLSAAQKMMRYTLLYNVYTIHVCTYVLLFKDNYVIVIFQDNFVNHCDEYAVLVSLSYGRKAQLHENFLLVLSVRVRSLNWCY